MNTERQKILQMLAENKISADEAARLLDCLSSETLPTTAKDTSHMQGKKLRIEVDGNTEEEGKINVNVSIPLILAHYADNIIANCLPDSANTELVKQGIDLRQLRIGDIVDTIETLDEDIVNADINSQEATFTVRIYVE